MAMLSPLMFLTVSALNKVTKHTVDSVLELKKKSGAQAKHQRAYLQENFMKLVNSWPSFPRKIVCSCCQGWSREWSYERVVVVKTGLQTCF